MGWGSAALTTGWFSTDLWGPLLGWSCAPGRTWRSVGRQPSSRWLAGAGDEVSFPGEVLNRYPAGYGSPPTAEGSEVQKTTLKFAITLSGYIYHVYPNRSTVCQRKNITFGDVLISGENNYCIVIETPLTPYILQVFIVILLTEASPYKMQHIIKLKF